jgi:hypothetical protein
MEPTRTLPSWGFYFEFALSDAHPVAASFCQAELKMQLQLDRISSRTLQVWVHTSTSLKMISTWTVIRLAFAFRLISAVWEHSSNTGVGLAGFVIERCSDWTSANADGQFTNILFVVADGYDSCPESDPTCGIESWPFGYFFKDFLHADLAMDMDQGNSFLVCWVTRRLFDDVGSRSTKRRSGQQSRSRPAQHLQRAVCDARWISLIAQKT